MTLRKQNELVLSKESMIAAVQHYLDTVLLKSPGQGVVSAVTWVSNGYDGLSSFRVTIVGPAEISPPARLL